MEINGDYPGPGLHALSHITIWSVIGFGICFLGGCAEGFHPISSHPLPGTPPLFTQRLLILQRPPFPPPGSLP